MPADIRVQVDDNLKEEATALYADLGMTLDEAIRLFLRRSVRERGLPFPMRRMSEMEKADAEIAEAEITGQGLVSYATNEEALAALDRL